MKIEELTDAVDNSNIETEAKAEIVELIRIVKNGELREVTRRSYNFVYNGNQEETFKRGADLLIDILDILPTGLYNRNPDLNALYKKMVLEGEIVR